VSPRRPLFAAASPLTHTPLTREFASLSPLTLQTMVSFELFVIFFFLALLFGGAGYWIYMVAQEMEKKHPGGKQISNTKKKKARDGNYRVGE
jgi:hypothetical protein